MSALDSLIRELRETCAGFPDRQQGPYHDGQFTMADIGLSAFSVFFMGQSVVPGPPTEVGRLGRVILRGKKREHWLDFNESGVQMVGYILGPSRNCQIQGVSLVLAYQMVHSSPYFRKLQWNQCVRRRRAGGITC